MIECAVFLMSFEVNSIQSVMKSVVLEIYNLCFIYPMVGYSYSTCSCSHVHV